MFLFLLISIIIVVLIYQAVFFWVFKDPVSIKGYVNKALLPNNQQQGVQEIKFKIDNRIEDSFTIEKIIVKIGEKDHILDNYRTITYPRIIKGFETFTLQLPIDFLRQLAEKDIEGLRKMLMKVSITIRGNNGSYSSNQIKFG